MERDKFIETLRILDLKVNKQGIVKDSGGKTYGMVRNTDIRMVNGKSVVFENADTLELVEADGSIKLFDYEGNVIGTISASDDRIDEDVVALNTMPLTDSELNDVFQILYPDSYDRLYYDELDEREMVDLAMFGMDGGIVPLNDNVENIYLDHIERRLKAENYVSLGPIFRPPSVEVRRRVLNTQIHKHRRNRFREWVESLTWDGIPRIKTWFKDKFKATAPPLQELGLEDEYLGKVADAWFMGAIKRMYSKTQHDVVPVLIGKQAAGKSSGLEYTAGPGDWFAATTINISNAAGVAQFLDSVRGKIVVELAEASTIRSADQEALKAFISKKEDQYRKPYARHEESFPRHFIMAATTNIAQVFTDITGNRRFYPIYCGYMTNREKKKCRTDKDVEQVWAEALALYKESMEKGDGEHVWYIPGTWKPAVIMQRFCTQDNMNVSVIDEWLDDPEGLYSKVGSVVTRDIIMADCFGLDIHRPLPSDCKKSWRAWQNATMAWARRQKRIGPSNKMTYIWERVKEPSEDFVYDDSEIEAEIREIEESESFATPDNIINIIRERATRYGFKDLGDIFPTDGLDKGIVDWLFNEGYIYEYGINDYRWAGDLP